MFKFFSDGLDICLAKGISYLIIKVLLVFHEILVKFNEAIIKMVSIEANLSNDFMIA